MSSYFDFEFTAPLAVRRVGEASFRVLYLPAALAASAPFAGRARVRMEGEIADVPVRAAWQPTADGRRFVMVSRKLCREAGLVVGRPCEVRFRLVDDADVLVPEELEAALAATPAARRAWERLTPGRRRGLAHLVAGASRPETRARRVEQVLAELAGAPPRRRRAT